MKVTLSLLARSLWNRFKNVSRMTVALRNHSFDQSTDSSSGPFKTWPCVDYITARNEPYPFSNHSLLDLVSMHCHEEIPRNSNDIMESVQKKRMSDSKCSFLRSFATYYREMFPVNLSAGCALTVRLLKINLKPELFLIRVCMSRYSRKQRTFQKEFAVSIGRYGIMYVNQLSARTNAPKIEPCPGTAKRERCCRPPLWEQIDSPSPLSHGKPWAWA